MIWNYCPLLVLNLTLKYEYPIHSVLLEDMIYQDRFPRRVFTKDGNGLSEK